MYYIALHSIERYQRDPKKGISLHVCVCIYVQTHTHTYDTYVYTYINTYNVLHIQKYQRDPRERCPCRSLNRYPFYFFRHAEA